MQKVEVTGNSRCTHGWRSLRGCVGFAAGVLLVCGVPTTVLYAATPTFTIVSPAAGSTVSDPVKLEIAVTGAEIGQPSSGDDHLHVMVDGGEVQAVYKNRILSLQLPPGKHTIGVDLAYPTHEPVSAWKFVDFTVR